MENKHTLEQQYQEYLNSCCNKCENCTNIFLSFEDFKKWVQEEK